VKNTDYPEKKMNRRINQESKKRRMKKSGMGFMKIMKNIYEKLKGGQ